MGVLAASEDTSENDWVTLVEAVVERWASYEYEDGFRLFPKPHWAKEMPSRIRKTPIVEYLRKAYANALAKINGVTLKILKRGNITKEETLEMFATPFVKDLFDL